MTVKILGTKYFIYEKSEQEDALLLTHDAYCDKTSKKIVYVAKPADTNLEKWDVYRRKLIRHEIIHAFLYESGLHECWEHSNGHDETMVDWIAAQFPKIKKAFKQANCD